MRGSVTGTGTADVPPTPCPPPAGQGTVPGVGLGHARTWLAPGPGLTWPASQSLADHQPTAQLARQADRQLDRQPDWCSTGQAANLVNVVNGPTRQSTGQLGWPGNQPSGQPATPSYPPIQLGPTSTVTAREPVGHQPPAIQSSFKATRHSSLPAHS
ncbi:hypothetical protein DUI87_22048 [Hirundo rustica rustica]|uniref:Uncharacterized protein n=1 Tax=Hirundo rustica rustica TaxID=333673 RepID=A0A3M0K3K7_HIRRU|nr:hypothetical protein DUI87_22048 [Hirundo rustica rustica]